jgi:hypothetical protein
MKKLIFLLVLTFGLTIIQAKDKDKYFYYYFSQQDVTEMKADLEKQGMTYKPMFVILDKDTLQVTQITEKDKPYRNTNPVLLCQGIPEKNDYTPEAVFIHLKKYKKIN